METAEYVSNTLRAAEGDKEALSFLNNHHKRTETVRFTSEQSSVQHALVMDYGLRFYKGQPPYMCLVGVHYLFDGRVTRQGTRWTEDSRFVEQSVGQVQGRFLDRLPAWMVLADRWHLTSLQSGPLHYVANSMFWWRCGNLDALRDKLTAMEQRIHELHAGSPQPMEAFKSACCYGLLPDDETSWPLPGQWKEDPSEWLDARKVRLMRSFELFLLDMRIVTQNELIALNAIRWQ